MPACLLQSSARVDTSMGSQEYHQYQLPYFFGIVKPGPIVNYNRSWASDWWLCAFSAAQGTTTSWTVISCPLAHDVVVLRGRHWRGCLRWLSPIQLGVSVALYGVVAVQSWGILQPGGKVLRFERYEESGPVGWISKSKQEFRPQLQSDPSDEQKKYTPVIRGNITRPAQLDSRVL
jgi:hypothetical protein